VILVLFVRSPDFLDAPDGARRWAPLIVGLICVGVWLLGWQQSEIMIESWEHDFGHGSVVAGLWVTGIGVAIVAISGAYATLRYHEGQTGDPTALIRAPRRSDAGPILTWVGGIAGMLIGAGAALSTFPPISASAPMVFMGGFGLIFGAYLGRAIGNRLGGPASRGP
jgi:hypothetical protein